MISTYCFVFKVRVAKAERQVLPRSVDNISLLLIVATASSTSTSIPIIASQPQQHAEGEPMKGLEKEEVA